MPIQAIIFDVGGVLIRTVDRGPRTELATRLGMTYEALDELVFGGERGYQTQRGEISSEIHWKYVCTQAGWPIHEWQNFKQAFFAGDVLDNNIIEEIHQLHANYKTAIISNAFDDLRSVLKNEWHIADAFDSITISGEVGIMKPDARIFQISLTALSLPPEAAIFIDDFAHNVEAAQRLGMQAVHFRNREQFHQELAQLLDGTQ